MECLQRCSSVASRQIGGITRISGNIDRADYGIPHHERRRGRALIDVPVRFSAVGSKNSSCWIQPRQFSRGIDPGRAVLDRNAA